MRRAFVAVLLALTGCNPAADGVRAYRDGRFAEAQAAFAAAEGDDPSAELLVDEALAALRAGDVSRAENCADRAAKSGGRAFEGLRDFVKGNASFARSAVSEAQADRVEAEPFAFDVAIAQAETAGAAWANAAKSRAEWPEALRNAARALAAIERLKEKKAKAERRKKNDVAVGKPQIKGKTDGPPPTPAPPKEKPGASDKQPPSRTPTAIESGELPAGEVARLFELLAEKERAKLDARRARRDERSRDVERDW